MSQIECMQDYQKINLSYDKDIADPIAWII